MVSEKCWLLPKSSKIKFKGTFSFAFLLDPFWLHLSTSLAEDSAGSGLHHWIDFWSNSQHFPHLFDSLLQISPAEGICCDHSDSGHELSLHCLNTLLLCSYCSVWWMDAWQRFLSVYRFLSPMATASAMAPHCCAGHWPHTHHKSTTQIWKARNQGSS